MREGSGKLTGLMPVSCHHTVLMRKFQWICTELISHAIQSKAKSAVQGQKLLCITATTVLNCHSLNVINKDRKEEECASASSQRLLVLGQKKRRQERIRTGG